MSDYDEAIVAAVDLPRPDPNVARSKRKQKIRTWWLRQFRTWHWISAAVSLVGMLLFAITGLTLNHAATISAKPRVTEHAVTLAPPLLAMLKKTPASDAPLPDAVAANLASILNLDARDRAAEWTDGEVYVAMPGPGRDAWISIDRASGAVTSEITDRGWVSYLNDLHKGRNSGAAWFWFIDVFAVACILFTITGLLLLNLHAKNRPSTWPLVALGMAIPLLIVIIFLH
ncbi:MAG: hypothetical protein JWO15_2991 [Sphingomonadales bacterium]|nr:hypothetical protein [Sphingomonadales bacterium]